MIKRFLAYGLMLVLLSGFWHVLGRPRPIPEADLAAAKRLQSVSYAPFAKDESPLNLGPEGPTLSPRRIDADLAILARRFDGIRTYSALGMAPVARSAEKHGLKVLLGAWVSADPVATRRELAEVIAIARRHRSCVRAVVVGNEALLRREVTGAQLAAYIREVKSVLPDIPVTYADVWEFWLKHPEVAPAVDFVTIHILPYWEDDPVAIDDAVTHVKSIRQTVGAKIPDRQIVIGEAGWPSRGRMREAALPSPVNQARFVRGFVAMAEAAQWPYNLIEAFDQPWKRANEGAVGGYWGLYDTHRREKSVFAGPVSNHPDGWLRFGLSVGLVLLTLPLAGRGFGESRFQWIGFSMLAPLGAVLIVLQGEQFTVVSHHAGQLVWAALVMAQAIIAYFLLLSAAVGRALPQRLSLAATLDLLRRQGPPRPETGRWSAFISIHRLVVVGLALVAVAGLVVAPRYRSFHNCGFFLPALTYAWLWYRADRPSEVSTGLEGLVALILTTGAAVIFIQETPLNWQADAWVATCLLLAYPFWRQGRGASLRPLGAVGLGLMTAYGLLTGLRFVWLEWDRLAAPCMQDPSGLYCLSRSVLGWLMYHQAFGWLALAFSLLAVWGNRTWLCLLAMVASLGGFVFYNVDLAALAIVPAGLLLAHRRLAAAA
jgi:glucan 1,3-beta-glucosidase